MLEYVLDPPRVDVDPKLWVDISSPELSITVNLLTKSTDFFCEDESLE